jgi:hypothetical protein
MCVCVCVCVCVWFLWFLMIGDVIALSVGVTVMSMLNGLWVEVDELPPFSLHHTRVVGSRDCRSVRRGR